jgi:type III secretion protein J
LSSAIAARPLCRSVLRRSSLVRLFALVLFAVGLAGCNVELYTDLDQKQANEIIATLFRQGIPAERVALKGGKFTVNVDESRFAEAVHILNENGLPRQQFATMGEVFKKDSLVSSPVQERAQMIYALSQELARTVSDIDGVLSSRVHLVLPENDPLRQQLVPSSASVFIRHQANAPLSDLVPQVKMLVANGVAGLSYDKVSVVLVPVEAREKPVTDAASDPGYSNFMGLWLHRESLGRAAWIFYGLLGLVLILGAGLGILLWNQRHRGVYTLQPASRAK